jgi:hypothetical protein
MPSSSEELLREPNLGQVRIVLTIHADDEPRSHQPFSVRSWRSDWPTIHPWCQARSWAGAADSNAANVAVTALSSVIGTTQVGSVPNTVAGPDDECGIEIGLPSEGDRGNRSIGSAT